MQEHKKSLNNVLGIGDITKLMHVHDIPVEYKRCRHSWMCMMRTLAPLLFFAACVAIAGDAAGLYGEGKAFFRIVSSEPTCILRYETMPNPDTPQEIWSSLVWSHDSSSPTLSAVSIAFDLRGSWSTQNFWQLDLENIGFPTNFTPTNAIQTLILRTLEHVTDPDSQRATVVSNLATLYARGWIIVAVTEAVPHQDLIALVESYGHSIKKALSSPGVFLVSVPPNEELVWVSRYQTNTIVRYAEPDGVIN